MKALGYDLKAEWVHAGLRIKSVSRYLYLIEISYNNKAQARLNRKAADEQDKQMIHCVN